MASRFSTWWTRRQIARKTGGCNEAGLIRSVRSGRPDLTLKLLEYGVSVDARDESGRSALFLAVKQGDIKLVDLLLQHGADPDLVDHTGDTALMESIIQADKHIFFRLLKASPALDKRNRQGNTSLLLAVKEGHTTFSRALIQAGSDINLANKLGRTPLMLAVMDSKTAIIQSLLEAGADPTQKDLSGKGVLDIPVSSPRIRKLLQKYAGEEESEPELRLNSVVNQMIYSARSVLGTSSSQQQLEDRGRRLLQAWSQFMGLPGVSDSEATIQTGAELFLLLMHEVQRGLKHATKRGHEHNPTSQNWENLESIVARLAAQLPEPISKETEQAPEQHIHFHLPALEELQKEDLNAALKEAITVGSGKATELLTQLEAMTKEGNDVHWDTVQQKYTEPESPTDTNQPDTSG